MHKQLCGTNNSTNLTSDSLLWVAKQLVRNHSATVEQFGVQLTIAQKEHATVGLVRKLKEMFTGKFSQYNASHLAADASNDSSFCADLAKFFAEQPGYEKVWGELSTGYKERLDIERTMKQSSDVLMVSEQAIIDQCKEVARTLMMTFGSVLTDGNVSEMTNIQRHNNLVAALVDNTKQFIRKRREYDSYSGLQQMTHDDEFKAEMGVVLAKFFSIETDEN